MTVASSSFSTSNPDGSSEMCNVDLENLVPEKSPVSPDIINSGSDNLSLSPEITLKRYIMCHQSISFIVVDSSTERWFL